MIDLQAIHHIGMPVADIGRAQVEMGEALGLDWAPVRRFDPLPFWTPEQGPHSVVVEATYSRGGGQRIELVQGSGPFYDPATVPDSRHVGLWVEDLVGEAERLVGLDWRVMAATDAPEAGYGVLAYLAPPGGGLLVELISTTIRGDIEAWIGD